MLYSLFGTFCAGFLITDSYDVLGLVAVDHERSDPVFTNDRQVVKLNKLFGVELLIDHLPVKEPHTRPVPFAAYGRLETILGTNQSVLAVEMLHLNIRGDRLSALYSEVREQVGPDDDYIGRLATDFELRTIGFRRDQYGLIEIIWHHGEVFGLRRNDLLPAVPQLPAPAAIAGEASGY